MNTRGSACRLDIAPEDFVVAVGVGIDQRRGLGRCRDSLRIGWGSLGHRSTVYAGRDKMQARPSDDAEHPLPATRAKPGLSLARWHVASSRFYAENPKMPTCQRAKRRVACQRRDQGSATLGSAKALRTADRGARRIVPWWASPGRSISAVRSVHSTRSFEVTRP